MHIAVRRDRSRVLNMIDVNDPYHFKAVQGIQAFPDAALEGCIILGSLDSLSVDNFSSGLLFAN